MFRNLVTSLLKHDRIQTTDTKAKELRRWVDHIITLAKRGDLHARRQALAIVREKNVVHKLFQEAAQRFGNIHGGYSRIVKIGRRPGDAAPVSLIELTAIPETQKKSASKKKTSQKKKVAESASAPPSGAGVAGQPEGQTSPDSATAAEMRTDKGSSSEPSSVSKES
jgi:large subunit ribosomal protein L17